MADLSKLKALIPTLSKSDAELLALQKQYGNKINAAANEMDQAKLLDEYQKLEDVALDSSRKRSSLPSPEQLKQDQMVELAKRQQTELTDDLTPQQLAAKMDKFYMEGQPLRVDPINLEEELLKPGVKKFAKGVSEVASAVDKFTGRPLRTLALSGLRKQIPSLDEITKRDTTGEEVATEFLKRSEEEGMPLRAPGQEEYPAAPFVGAAIDLGMDATNIPTAGAIKIPQIARMLGKGAEAAKLEDVLKTTAKLSPQEEKVEALRKVSDYLFETRGPADFEFKRANQKLQREIDALERSKKSR